MLSMGAGCLSSSARARFIELQGAAVTDVLPLRHAGAPSRFGRETSGAAGPGGRELLCPGGHERQCSRGACGLTPPVARRGDVPDAHEPRYAWWPWAPRPRWAMSADAPVTGRQLRPAAVGQATTIRRDPTRPQDWDPTEHKAGTRPSTRLGPDRAQGWDPTDHKAGTRPTTRPTRPHPASASGIPPPDVSAKLTPWPFVVPSEGPCDRGTARRRVFGGRTDSQDRMDRLPDWQWVVTKRLTGRLRSRPGTTSG